MNSLSRREEDTLLKATKAYALKQCDDVLKGAFFLAAGPQFTKLEDNRICGVCDRKDNIRSLGVSESISSRPGLYDQIVRLFITDFNIFSQVYKHGAGTHGRGSERVSAT